MAARSQPQDDVQPTQQDLYSEWPEAAGHDRDQSASPRAHIPEERKHIVGESLDVDGGPTQQDVERTSSLERSLGLPQTFAKFNNVKQADEGPRSDARNDRRHIGRVFAFQSAWDSRKHSRIERREFPELGASWATQRILQLMNPDGTPDLEGSYGTQSNAYREAVQVQQTPKDVLDLPPKDTEQRLPKSAPGSLEKGEKESERSVQGDKDEELRLLKTGQSAEPREWRQECRFLHDKIFSRLDYLVQRIIFAIPLGIYVIRYLRPKLPAGCKRIEWQCSCGVLLYSDYHITSPASALALKSLGGRLRATTLSSSNDASYTSPSRSERGDEERSSSSSQTTMSSVDLTNLPLSSTESPDGSSPVRQRDGSVLVTSQTFLELCVSTAPRRTVLEEILIRTRGGTDRIDNDFDLLRVIRSVYYAERHKTKYRWLRTAVDIHFVKFAGSTAEPNAFYVDIHEEPALPPAKMIAEGLYHMTSLPNLDLPIRSNSFLHELTTHPMSIDINDRKWLPLFPKKCRESVKPPNGNRLLTVQAAWGVQIIEGPSSGIFLFATAVLAGVLIAIGLAVASALGDTYKGVAVAVGGFAIGSHLIKETKELIKDSTGPSKEKKS